MLHPLCRIRVLLGLVLFVLLVAPATRAHAGHRPELDVTAASVPTPAMTSHLRRLERDPVLRRIATPTQLDSRFAVPTFAWANRTAVATPLAGAPARDAAAVGRAHLGRVAPLWRLERGDVEGATLRHLHDTGRGGVIATFQQTVDGIEVFRDEIKVLMDRNLELLAVSGRIPSRALVARGEARRFRLDGARAAATALADFSGTATGAAPLRSRGAAGGGYEVFEVEDASLPAEYAPSQPVRVKPVWFHVPGRLEPGWYVELMSEAAAYGYVVSATDGAILYRHDQTATDAFTYRVWAGTTLPNIPFDGPQGDGASPHPTALPDNYDPPLILPNLVTLQNGPISTNDPWLPPGATETTGNNVDAYADLASPDGFTAGDLRASTTAPNTFDRIYDTSQPPTLNNDQRMASVTQLFYVNNFLHDWFYDSGFDEAAGNAQASNYGRGGLEGDRLRAEGQDYSGTNNANMSTPSDGGTPRMQMYVFNHPGTSSLTVDPGNTVYATGVATGFGPQSFDLTDDLILGIDAIAPVNDGCSALTNGGSVSGKVVLLDRGTCNFSAKALTAQNAGAVGLIIADNVASGTPPGLGGVQAGITIPVLSVTQATGNTLKTMLGGGPVTVRMQRTSQLSRDGTIDNTIVAHEWGHYISNRLIGNSNGLGNQQGGGMGEGWGDFIALLMAVREADGLVPSNPDFAGVYGEAGYANSRTPGPNNSYYFGFRRYPYSTDFDYNPLTFQHIQNGVALPVGPPISFGGSGASNAEVHNTGEVWCVMLWECYAALIRDDPRLTFAEAQQRMRDYVVSGCKLMPANPTFVEARDAMLAAAYANDPADYALFTQAFARRGLGTGAVAPDRYSTDNIGVIESYAVGGDVAMGEATLLDDINSCDSDGYLDEGERGNLMIEVRNTGMTTLSATTVSLSSTNPAVTFPSGNSRPVPAAAPFSTHVVSVPVELTGAVGIEELSIEVAIDDPGLLVAGPRIASVALYGNVDETPSTTETVEALNPGWTVSSAPPIPDSWDRSPLAWNDHRFHGPDYGGIADQYLESPELHVAGTGSFGILFQQAHSFEWDASTWWDGGVIELSTFDGVNWGAWNDIGSSAVPGYGGTLTTASGNPLGGRAAYVGVSGGYPSLTATSIDLGTSYQGQTVKVRFRIGTDAAVGAPGWDLDNLEFVNITNAPFLALVAEGDACTPLAVGDPLPRETSFALAGPNPVTGRARFRFALPAETAVDLAIHDVSGRRVATLASGRYGAGEHSATWERGSRSGAGVYFARFTAGGVTFTRRLVLVH